MKMQGLYLRENKSLVREGQESNIIYFTVMYISGIIFQEVQGLARRKKKTTTGSRREVKWSGAVWKKVSRKISWEEK